MFKTSLIQNRKTGNIFFSFWESGRPQEEKKGGITPFPIVDDLEIIESYWEEKKDSQFSHHFPQAVPYL